MSFRSVAAVAAIVCAWGATSSQAATVTTAGVTNLKVGTKIYNVAFQDGTCASLFDGCDEPGDFPFFDETGSLAFLALRDALNDDQMFTPEGCISIPSLCTILTPYFLTEDLVGVGVDFIFYDVLLGNFWSSPFPFGYRVTLNTADAEDLTFAVWTEVGVIPLPAGAPLVLSGLAALAGLGWRKRRADRRAQA
jgi:hypothetical protein